MTGRLAFLFPGQGSQRPRMGRELKAARPDLFDRYVGGAAAASGLPLDRLCIEGSLEQLTPTDIAQPALFALSVALHQAAREAGLEPDFVAGHSLGEYSAAVAAGSLDFDSALPLVCERGRLMAGAQRDRPGSMAAITGLPVERIRQICAQASERGLVVLANVNSATQLVVSGETAGIERAVELAKAEGAEGATVLRVGAAFHSPLMEPTEVKMAKLIDAVRFADQKTPVVVNVWARAVSSGTELQEALKLQISRPVRWYECVKVLLEAGCRTYLELGSGRVLAGLVRLTGEEVVAQAADSPSRIEQFKTVVLAGD